MVLREEAQEISTSRPSPSARSTTRGGRGSSAGGSRLRRDARAV